MQRNLDKEMLEGLRRIRIGKTIIIVSFLAFIPVGILSAVIEAFEKSGGISPRDFNREDVL